MDERQRAREVVRVKAMDRYWNDAEFHARVELTRRLEREGPADRNDLNLIIIATYLATAPIEETTFIRKEPSLNELLAAGPTAEQLASWNATGMRPDGRLIPADPCPCGAFARTSQYHKVECTDFLPPED